MACKGSNNPLLGHVITSSHYEVVQPTLRGSNRYVCDEVKASVHQLRHYCGALSILFASTPALYCRQRTLHSSLLNHQWILMNGSSKKYFNYNQLAESSEFGAGVWGCFENNGIELSELVCTGL